MRAMYHLNSRENTKNFDNKLSKLNKTDQTLKALKKELTLMINFLKLRLVNIDTIEEEKMIKGYLVDVERNAVKYIELNKERDDEIESCVLYWNAMRELHSGAGKASVNIDNTMDNNFNNEEKENAPIMNNLNKISYK